MILYYEFGTVLQHPLLKTTLWMVIRPFETPSGRTEYLAMRLDNTRGERCEQGAVMAIGGTFDEKTGELNWNVLEVIRV